MEDEVKDGDLPVESDNSIIARLRERRDELVKGDHYLDLEVPGYGGELWVRYEPVPFEELNKATRRLQHEDPDQRTLLGSLDTIARACRQVMIKVNGELVPINPEAIPPIRFDKRLASLLNIEGTDRARDLVRQVFNNDFAVIRHDVTYTRWLNDVTQKADETFMGE